MGASTTSLLTVQSSVEGIVWPRVHLGPAATLTSLMHYLEWSQWLPRERLLELQFTQLALLIRHAEAYSPYFRQRLRDARSDMRQLSSPEGFKHLPVMTRRDVQEAGELLFCTQLPPEHLPSRIINTSGSTGEPVTIRKTAVTNLFWQADTMREHFWHARDLSGKVMVIQSLDNEAYIDQLGWGPPLHFLFGSGPVRSIPIAIDLKEQIREIQAFGPEHLVSYPNNIEGIINQCQLDGICITGIEHVWCNAETLTTRLRQKASEFFTASIEDNYSSEEVGIMALQCPDSGLYHVMAESIILEVLNEDGSACAPGETGRVVVTDLHNFATPVIRYDTGDHAQVGDDCPCGRGLPTLAAIMGRERNLIHKPHGVRHWPRINFSEFPHKILQHQVIQHSLEDLEVRIVARPRLNEAQENELRVHLTRSMGYPFRFRFTYFEDRLPLSPTGKFEEFICRI